MGGTSRAELVLSGNAQFLGGTGSMVTNKSTVAGNTSISLSSNALLSVRAVYGGTLAVAGTSKPPVPFMSGCVATLGADGLTLDSKGFDVTLDQDFTAAGGAASAAFTKTGFGRLTRDARLLPPADRPRAGCARLHERRLALPAMRSKSPKARPLVLNLDALGVHRGRFDRLSRVIWWSICPRTTRSTMRTRSSRSARRTRRNSLRRSQWAIPVMGKNYAFSRSEDGLTVSVTVHVGDLRRVHLEYWRGRMERARQLDADRRAHGTTTRAAVASGAAIVWTPRVWWVRSPCRRRPP